MHTIKSINIEGVYGMCTNFTLERRSDEYPVISARTMDWINVDPLPTEINFVPRQQSFPEFPVENEISWKNKYAFIGALHSFPDRAGYSDGLNEKGLSVASLWLDATEYPKPGCKSSIIANTHIVSYILGNFKNIKEVNTALRKLTVIDIAKDYSRTLHFIITDSNGEHLIVEFIKGKMITYTNKIGVLTNDPEYSWHLTNICNYKNLSLTNYSEHCPNYIQYGTGQFGIPGDPTSPSRFVRAEFLRRSTFNPSNEQEWVGLAHQILRTLSVPSGTAWSAEYPTYDWTQWGVIRDHTNLTYYFFTDFNSTLYGIHLSELNYNAKCQKRIPIIQKHWYVDYTEKFE